MIRGACVPKKKKKTEEEKNHPVRTEKSKYILPGDLASRRPRAISLQNGGSLHFPFDRLRLLLSELEVQQW